MYIHEFIKAIAEEIFKTNFYSLNYFFTVFLKHKKINKLSVQARKIL